jgi:hypothetical protein
LVQQLLSL